MLFTQLGLIQPILEALQIEGYSTPTPIQQQSIPIILEGRDLLGCAQTGTGKTAAFALPMLQMLSQNHQHPSGIRKIKALILSPTRELAIQIDESFTAYGKFLKLKNTVIFGGVSQGSQTEALRKGIDILIATPGRMIDLYQQGFIDLKSLEFFVLDEADRMLDMGFIHDVKKIIQFIPAKRQSLFFSATMPPVIVDLSKKILTNPKQVEVTPVSSTAETVQQKMYFVNKPDKTSLLIHLLKGNEINTALVFSRTKHGADKIAKSLNKEGIKTEALHGNKSQSARQRALENFKAQKTRVLVATDIAARGIDVDDLSHVINFDIPNIPETYVHRIGRTGRAGASGIAFSFCDVEERPFLKDIQKLIQIAVPVENDHPFLPTDNAPVEMAQAKVAQPKPDLHKLTPKPQQRSAAKKKFWGNRERRSQEIKK
ncbi:MAG: DEAD/DEAH box helicase [Saprospiraceae bacterium]